MYKINYLSFFCLFFLLHTNSNSLSAQNVDARNLARNGQDLYKDATIWVKLYIATDSSSCEANSNSFCSYKFKIVEKQSQARYQYLNFTFDYVDCESHVISYTTSLDLYDPNVQQDNAITSVDYKFQGKGVRIDPSTKLLFYNVTLSDENRQEVKSKYSKKADNITGDKVLKFGKTSTLYVNGGNLSQNAKWVWRADNCDGTIVGYGASLEIKPEKTITYFVRAEEENIKSECVSFIAEVDGKSYMERAEIEGGGFACPGKPINLSVSGGVLGRNAKWCWYTSEDCTKPSKIGEGASITVNPTTNITYYLRAEGSENNSGVVSTVINIETLSKKPGKINGVEKLCYGDEFTLKFEGGKLGSNANWVWYIGDTYLGNGETIKIRGSGENKAYKVRAESKCLNSEFSTITIAGFRPSQVNGISKELNSNNKLFLTVNGKLGDNAYWVWYKGKNSVSTKFNAIGRGETIEVPHLKYRTYKVSAVGGICDNPSPSLLHIVGRKIEKHPHNFSLNYYKNNGYRNNYCNKGIHFGFGIGPSYINLLQPAVLTTFSNPRIIDSSLVANISTIGLEGQFMFHPFIYERPKELGLTAFATSIGFYYNIGIANYSTQILTLNKESFGTFSSLLNNQFSYSTYGGEATLGWRGFKFYYSYERTMNNTSFSALYRNDYTNRESVVSYDDNSILEKNKLGLRLGRYANKSVDGGKAVCYDFYVMQVNSAQDIMSQNTRFYSQGAGLAIWIQSLMKFKAEGLLDANGNYLINSSLMFNLDFFY
jgi:hypothetical protein